MLAESLLNDSWERVSKNSHQDFIPLPAHYEIYRRHLADNLKSISSRIQDGYSFSAPIRIDVPKHRLTLRPGTQMDINDQVVYESCVAQLYLQAAPSLVREQVSDVVFSHSTEEGKRTGKLLGSWKRQYLRWREHCRERYESGHRYLVTSDIAGYHENISHRILFNQLEGHRSEGQSLELLRKGLRRWQDGSDSGVPQGPDASNLLGEIYLDDVDKFMVRKGYAYTRWVDDFRIFARDHAEAKIALRDLVRQLRRLTLVVQSGKTRIWEEEMVLPVLDPIEHQKAILQDQIEENIIEKILQEVAYLPFYDPFAKDARDYLRIEYAEKFEAGILERLFDIGKSEGSETHLRYLKFALGELMRSRNPYGTAHVEEVLITHPHVTDRLVAYIQAVDSCGSTETTLLRYLTSRHNVYDWAEMWLMYYFAHQWRRQSEEVREVLRSTIEDRNRHVATRYYAIIAWANHADSSDLRTLQARYDSESDGLIREAIILSLRRLPRAERNAFYSACAGENIHLDQAAQFVRQCSEEGIDQLFGRAV